MLQSVVLIFSGLVVLPASAAWLTGNDLKKYCSGSPMEKAICLGYVMAVSDQLSTAVHSDVTRQVLDPPVVCVPNKATNMQFMEVTLKHLEENPSMLHWEAHALVHNALKRAFPCN